MDKINYTIINHTAREALDLSWLEYGLADLIYNLSNNPKSSYPNWCYASKKTLAKNLGITERQIYKLLNKLEDKKLVERHSETSHLKTTAEWYNLVVINKKDSKQSSYPMNKVHIDTEQSSYPYTEQSSYNKDINNKDNNKDIIPSNEQIVAGKVINDLINLFEPINPSFDRLFSNKTQRSALERILKRFGIEKTKRILEKLPEVLSQAYSPSITTPLQLENKMGDLFMFVRKEQSKGGGFLDASI